MKKSRFSDEEKIAILKEVRAGATVVATCAKHNIGLQTYHWVEAQVWRDEGG
jgi:transposase-like protein